MMLGVPHLHLELHRGGEQQPHPDGPSRELAGEPTPRRRVRRVGPRRGELPEHGGVALGRLVEWLHDGALGHEHVAVVHRCHDLLVVDADLLVGVVLADGEAHRQVGQAGLAVGIRDGEVGEVEPGAVRPEAQPQHEEDDAGDEDQRQHHRAQEVDAPDHRALPVVQRQPVRRHRRRVGGAR
uniref:Uncharacterized protein n=1 Tax=Setaria italica TaxID=4555 RepID=K3ZXA0_SETIT